MESIGFNLSVDGAPYIVKATPCRFNENIQYRVVINGGDEVLFTFNSELGRFAPVGDDAISVPDNLEIAIGNKLNSNSILNS